MAGSWTILLSAYIRRSSSTLMMIDLVGIARRMQQGGSAPSAHKCLKPLEARNLLIGEGEKALVPSITTKDSILCFSEGPVGCGGRVQTRFQREALEHHQSLNLFPRYSRTFCWMPWLGHGHCFSVSYASSDIPKGSVHLSHIPEPSMTLEEGYSSLDLVHTLCTSSFLPYLEPP